MASIRVRAAPGRRIITIKGRLRAADLGRLERACGPALEQRELALELRLAEVSTVDGPSQRFVQLLALRGAIVRWSQAEDQGVPRPSS